MVPPSSKSSPPDNKQATRRETGVLRVTCDSAPAPAPRMTREPLAITGAELRRSRDRFVRELRGEPEAREDRGGHEGGDGDDRRSVEREDVDRSGQIATGLRVPRVVRERGLSVRASERDTNRRARVHASRRDAGELLVSGPP